MMADLIPQSVRGSYFGLRNRIANFVALIASFISAGLLQLLTGNTRLAFAIIFAGALIGRMGSVFYLSRMFEPRPVLSTSIKRESIFQIARSLYSTNVGRFIIFAVVLNLAQNIDAPFFSVYLLRELKVSYISYQIITAMMAVITTLVIGWWGKRADKAGNIRILHLTAMMIPFVSILYLVSSHVLWLCSVQIFSGFAWAGFNLCVILFIWDAAPQENRTRFIVLYSAMNALGITIGSLIGGNIGPHLPRISGSYFLSIFLLAGIVKLAVIAVLFRRISEVRKVKRVTTTELLFGSLRTATIKNWWQKISGRR
jgi:MFS family permease